jgi:hypothetical protein
MEHPGCGQRGFGDSKDGGMKSFGGKKSYGSKKS